MLNWFLFVCCHYWEWNPGPSHWATALALFVCLDKVSLNCPSWVQTCHPTSAGVAGTTTLSYVMFNWNSRSESLLGISKLPVEKKLSEKVSQGKLKVYTFIQRAFFLTFCLFPLCHISHFIPFSTSHEPKFPPLVPLNLKQCLFIKHVLGAIGK